MSPFSGGRPRDRGAAQGADVIAATVRPVTALGEEEPAKLVLSWPLSELNTTITTEANP
jgi:hypothetical protein